LLAHLSIHRPQQWDWMITIQFYMVLHLTKAYLRYENVNESLITTHKDIATIIKHRIKLHDPFLNAIIALNPNMSFRMAYDSLQDLSNRARYLEGKNKTLGYNPIDAKSAYLALVRTDALLAHFLHLHNTQAPFHALTHLPTITFQVHTPNAFLSRSGLFKIN
jgi:hypothetical protein